MQTLPFVPFSTAYGLFMNLCGVNTRGLPKQDWPVVKIAIAQIKAPKVFKRMRHIGRIPNNGLGAASTPNKPNKYYTPGDVLELKHKPIDAVVSEVLFDVFGILVVDADADLLERYMTPDRIGPVYLGESNSPVSVRLFTSIPRPVDWWAQTAGRRTVYYSHAEVDYCDHNNTRNINVELVRSQTIPDNAWVTIPDLPREETSGDVDNRDSLRAL